ncbi:MAG: cytidylate kinase family protein, partial [Bacillota bacterium]
MVNDYPLVITISRQLGSGGAYLGQKLAEKMNMLYFDREIIKKVAEKLGLITENLEWCDEKVISRWQSIMNSMTYVQNALYSPPEYVIPSSKEIFEAETD